MKGGMEGEQEAEGGKPAGYRHGRDEGLSVHILNRSPIPLLLLSSSSTSISTRLLLLPLLSSHHFLSLPLLLSSHHFLSPSPSPLLPSLPVSSSYSYTLLEGSTVSHWLSEGGREGGREVDRRRERAMGE